MGSDPNGQVWGLTPKPTGSPLDLAHEHTAVRQVRTPTRPRDRHQGFVLGNKVVVGSVNASRADFERGVADLAQAELSYRGWLGKLLTHPVKGLENYATLRDTLTTGRNAIKVFCEVA